MYEEYKQHTKTEDVCPEHNTPYWVTTVHEGGEKKPIRLCPRCAKEGIVEVMERLANLAGVSAEQVSTYDVLGRDSLVSDKLKECTLVNYESSTQVDQEALRFANRLLDQYAKGAKGNAIITGPSGVGKSHLSYGIAKELNEQARAKSKPVSVLYVSVVTLFNKIEESFDTVNGYSKAKMIDLLTGVDYLFLDDLGKESRKENSRAKNEWRQSILYEILDNRNRTIINTNLTSQEIKELYADGYGNGALSSRIFEGVAGNVFVYPKGTKDKRY